mmetsp:Transcript_23769/g.55412  ORF Transcript_23769/g.55412 Transcript_23769/m.55412 type:complete len:260 (-) Transcript_23769:229-1008(-)
MPLFPFFVFHLSLYHLFHLSLFSFLTFFFFTILRFLFLFGLRLDSLFGPLLSVFHLCVCSFHLCRTLRFGDRYSFLVVFRFLSSLLVLFRFIFRLRARCCRHCLMSEYFHLRSLSWYINAEFGFVNVPHKGFKVSIGTDLVEPTQVSTREIPQGLPAKDLVAFGRILFFNSRFRVQGIHVFLHVLLHGLRNRRGHLLRNGTQFFLIQHIQEIHLVTTTLLVAPVVLGKGGGHECFFESDFYIRLAFFLLPIAPHGFSIL